MMATKFYNSRLRITDSGGAVRVTIASNVGQGNGGTSLPCKGCFVGAAAANTSVVVMNIGVAASASLGIEVPKSNAGGGMFIPVDDVASLYFYGASDNDVINLLYFT
jgi:hypothetical protein